MSDLLTFCALGAGFILFSIIVAIWIGGVLKDRKPRELLPAKGVWLFSGTALGDKNFPRDLGTIAVYELLTRSQAMAKCTEIVPRATITNIDDRNRIIFYTVA